MSATVEIINDVERRLHMTVPLEEIDREVDSRLRRLLRTTKTAGFRPGKVPLKVVALQYGGRVRAEVIEEAMERAFEEAVSNQNLRVAGDPKIEQKADSVDPDHVEFSATFEVYPEIKVGSFAGATAIERPTVTVGDAEVDKTIEVLRKQRGGFEPVDRPAAKGDQVKVDFNGKLDGIAFDGGSAQDFKFNVGAGQMLPEFDSAVVGMKTGETKTFPLTFPADYQSSNLAGRTVTFEVTLKEVQVPKVAELNADFARSLGIEDGDIAKMRAGIKENVEREVKRRVQARLKDQVMKALQEVVPVEVPSTLIDLEEQRFIEDMKERGLKDSDLERLSEILRVKAKRTVALRLIFTEVVKANSLQPTSEQVREIVEEQAASYEKPEEIVRWYYADPSRLAEIEAMVVEDNVITWTMTRVPVLDKPVTFDELMGNAA